MYTTISMISMRLEALNEFLKLTNLHLNNLFLNLKTLHCFTEPSDTAKKLFGSGLQIVSPTSVSVLRAMEIILAYLCQILVMGQYPNAICIGGAFLVMGSVLGIAIDEKLNNHSSWQIFSVYCNIYFQHILASYLKFANNCHVWKNKFLQLRHASNLNTIYSRLA